MTGVQHDEVPPPPRRLALLGAALAVAAPPALAVDADDDGYHVATFPKDCDDGDHDVNPNALEEVGDGIDQDCDRFDAGDRKVTAVTFGAPAWGASGSFTFGGDTVTVGGTESGSAWRTFNAPISHGAVVLSMDIVAKTGAADCTARVETHPWAGGASVAVVIPVSAAGPFVSGALATLDAPRVLGKVTFACPAGASMTVDWLAIGNDSLWWAPHVDADWEWVDVDAPGGGAVTAVVRAARSWAKVGGLDWGWASFDPWSLVYAAGDNSGVAVRSIFGWRAINGTEAGATLQEQAMLAVWDVIDAHGALTILTGRPATPGYVGYLMESLDGGDSWQVVADSLNDEVAGRGRLDPADGSESVYNGSGGRLLVADPDVDVLYFANGDPDWAGARLWMRGASGQVCEVSSPPYAGLPTDGWIRALELTRSAYGNTTILVGLSERGATDPSLWACTPDGLLPTCGGMIDVHCVPVDGSAGMDVRDIEILPGSPEEFFLAEATTDRVYRGEVNSLFAAPFADPWLDPAPLSRPLRTAEDHVTGLMFDPTGDLVYAFVPMGAGAPYEYDRILRASTADLGDTGVWTPINGAEEDEGDRAARVDGRDAWLTGPEDTGERVARPNPYPARHAPGNAVDGTFVEWADGSTSAYLANYSELWEVDGLDLLLDPDTWTSWAFGPDPNATERRTWQTTTAIDVAAHGADLWVGVMDAGLFHRPAPPPGDPAPFSQLDCLWHGLSTGSASVDAARDGAVWVATRDQGYAGKDDADACTEPDGSTEDDRDPWRMGVFRTLDGGLSWEYAAAGYTSNDRLVDDEGLLQAVCEDEVEEGLDGWPVMPFHPAHPALFSDDDVSTDADTWGNPKGIQAVDEHTAVVAFTSYCADEGEHTGKLAYTVDGGTTWNDVDFDGDWDGDFASVGAETADCQAYDFYRDDLFTEFALLTTEGTSSVGEAAHGDGALHAGDQLVLYLTSRQAGPGVTSQDGQCGLARVQITSTSTTWTWIALPLGGVTGTACGVGEDQITGVVESPWPPELGGVVAEEVFLWGKWATWENPGSGIRKYGGGACAMTRDAAGAVAFTRVVNPAFQKADVGAVAPSPYMTDLLFVGLAASVSSQGAYVEAETSLDRGVAWPLLAERRDDGTWAVDAVDYEPLPNFAVTSADWGSQINMAGNNVLLTPMVVVGTAGSGAWTSREAP